MLEKAQMQKTATPERVDPFEMLQFYRACLLHTCSFPVPLAFSLVKEEAKRDGTRNILSVGFESREADPKDLGGMRVCADFKRCLLEIGTLRTQPLKKVPSGFDLCDFWLQRTIVFVAAFGLKEITYNQSQKGSTNGQAASLLRIGFVPDVLLDVKWDKIQPPDKARIWQRKLEADEMGSVAQLQKLARTPEGQQAFYKASSRWRWNLGLV